MRYLLVLLILLLTTTPAPAGRVDRFEGDRYAAPAPEPVRAKVRKHAAKPRPAPRRPSVARAAPRPLAAPPPAPLDAPPTDGPLRALYLLFAAALPPREVDVPVPEPARANLFEAPPLVQNLLAGFLDWLFRPVVHCQGWESTHPRVRRVVEDAARHFRSTAVLISCNRTRARQVDIYRKMGRKPAMASWHLKNAAADFKVVGVRKHELHAFVRHHRLAGGVGLYAGWDSIHVDAGPRRSWCWGCGKK